MSDENDDAENTHGDVVDNSKSPNDRKQYKLVHLENGLRLLLISDLYSDNTDRDEKKVSSSSRKRQRGALLTGSGDDEGDSDGSFSSSSGDDDSGDEADEDASSEDSNSCKEAMVNGEHEHGNAKKLKQNTDNVVNSWELPTACTTERDAKHHHQSREEDETVKQPQTHRRAALGIGVEAGSFHDPEDIQGLAHFLEHMVFMGSSKYPGENDFEQFLADRGGFSNAMTELEYTVFYFEVLGKYFEDAAERFSQFFIKPLCKKAATDRELQAIEDEFASANHNDFSRLEGLMAFTSHPLHVLHKFSWGNIKSLKTEPEQNGIDPHEHLFRLFESLYSSDRMHVVARASYNLQQLEDMMVPIFNRIPRRNTSSYTVKTLELSRNMSPFVFSVETYGNGFRLPTPCIYRVKPVKTRSVLNASWAIPSSEIMLQASRCVNHKPDEYVAHLLGHEASGSLLSELKRRGWATDLCAGISDEGFERNSCCAIFSVNVTVTNSGLENWHTLVDLLFAYIGVVRTSGPPVSVFEEIRKMSILSYRFQEDEDPREHVERLSAIMAQQYQGHKILPGPFLVEAFDVDSVRMLLNCLSPEKIRVDLMHPSFHASSDDKHGTEQDVDVTSVSSSDNDDGSDVKKDGGKVEFVPVQVPFLREEPEVLAEPYFGCIYSTETVPQYVVEQWRETLDNDAMHKEVEGLSSSRSRNYENIFLPQINPYVPDNLEVQYIDSAAKDLRIRVQDFLFRLCKQSDEMQTPPSISPDFISGCCLHPSVIAVDHDPQNTEIQLWHHRDTRYLIPKSFVTIRFICPMLFEDSKYYVYASLWVDLVLDALTEDTYMAHLADLQLAIRCDYTSVYVTVYGFNDKLPILLGRAMNTLFYLQPKRDRFEAVKEAMLRRWRNQYIRPSSYVNYLRLLFLCRNKEAHEKLVDTLSDISLEDMLSKCSSLVDTQSHGLMWSRCFTQIFVYGDETIGSSQRLAAMISGYFPKIAGGLSRQNSDENTSLECDVHPPLSYMNCCIDSTSREAANGKINELNEIRAVSSSQRVLVRVLQKGTRYLIQSEQRYNAVCTEHYFQIGPESVRNYAKAAMLDHIMSETLFDTLRTKQQLGYHVGCSTCVTHGMLGFTITVQSSKWSPKFLSDRIEDFLRYFRKILSYPDTELFNKQLNSLIDIHLQPENNMLETFEQFISEIIEGKLDFEAREHLSLALRHVSIDAIREFYDEIFCPPRAKQLVLQQFSPGVDEVGSNEPFQDADMGNDQIEIPSDWNKTALFHVTLRPSDIKSEAMSGTFASIKYCSPKI